MYWQRSNVLDKYLYNSLCETQRKYILGSPTDTESHSKRLESSDLTSLLQRFLDYNLLGRRGESSPDVSEKLAGVVTTKWDRTFSEKLAFF
jgi:hypothetical protein